MRSYAIMHSWVSAEFRACCGKPD